MDRFKRFRAYARAWATGEVQAETHDDHVVAAAIGVRDGLDGHDLKTIQDLDIAIGSLGISAEDDEPDPAAAEREQRQTAEAQARLAKLLAVGDLLPASGSLLDAAADEIERLRAHIDVQTRELEHDGKIAQRFKRELQQAKEALEQARAKAEKLRHEVEIDDRLLEHRTRLLQALPCPVHGECHAHALQEIRRLQSAEKEARDAGAAEMRERAAEYLTAHADGDAGLLEIAERLRALSLSHDLAHVDIDAGERRKSETFRALEAMGVEFGRAMQAARIAEEEGGAAPETAHSAVLRLAKSGSLQAIMCEGRPSPEMLRDYIRAMLGQGAAGERGAAKLDAEKEPAAAGMAPGRVTGEEAATTGPSSVAEPASGAQGVMPCPRASWDKRRPDMPTVNGNACSCPGVEAPRVGSVVGVCNACGNWRSIEADVTHALPKPPRVEAGQRWKHSHDPSLWTVDEVDRHNDDMLATLRTGEGRVTRVCESWLIKGPFWTFLGPAPTPQGPGPQREPATRDDAADSPSEPTARDAVAGMVYRYGWEGTGAMLGDGEIDAATAIDRIRSSVAGRDPKAIRCIAALEALVRGDLRVVRDLDLRIENTRLAGERDLARKDADVMRAYCARVVDEREAAKRNAELRVKERNEARAALQKRDIEFAPTLAEIYEVRAMCRAKAGVTAPEAVLRALVEAREAGRADVQEEADTLRAEVDGLRAEAAALREEVERYTAICLDNKVAAEHAAGELHAIRSRIDEAEGVTLSRCRAKMHGAVEPADAADRHVDRWSRASAALRDERDPFARGYLYGARDAFRVAEGDASAASPLQPAEDIAREEISDAREVQDCEHFAYVLGMSVMASPTDVDMMRKRLTRLIERSRAEGKRAAGHVAPPEGTPKPWRVLTHKAEPSRGWIDCWTVTAWDATPPGRSIETMFSGPHAEDRAREYAAWVSAPVPPSGGPGGGEPRETTEKPAPSSANIAAPERAGEPTMRIEQRADGEWLVGAPDHRTGCNTLGNSPVRYICTHHLNGEHLATYENDGDKHICERWPIAPAQDEQPGQVVAESDRIESADGNIVVEMPRSADPRAVLATVAELLGLTERETERGDYRTESPDQILERAIRDAGRGLYIDAAHLRGVAAGIREGERRSQARHVEPATAAPDRERLGRAAHDVYRSTYAPTATLGWDHITDEGRARWATIGDRLFNMGVQWAQRSESAPSRPTDEQVQDHINLGSLAYDRGVEEGERRAKAKAAELHERWRGLMALDARDVDHDDAGAAANARGWVRCRGVCMRDLRARFDLPDTDPGQPPTGGEQGSDVEEHGCGGPREACAQPGCDECGSARSAIERAHANGIVEGLCRADGIIRSFARKGELGADEHGAIAMALDNAIAEVGSATRQPHVDRASLLALAEGWETQYGSWYASAQALGDRGLFLKARAAGLETAAMELRRLLDVPRGPGGGEPKPGAEDRPAVDPAAVERIADRFAAADPKWLRMFAEVERRYPGKARWGWWAMAPRRRGLLVRWIGAQAPGLGLDAGEAADVRYDARATLRAGARHWWQQPAGHRSAFVAWLEAQRPTVDGEEIGEALVGAACDLLRGSTPDGDVPPGPGGKPPVTPEQHEAAQGSGDAAPGVARGIADAMQAHELVERWRERVGLLADIGEAGQVDQCALELCEAFGLDPEGAAHEPDADSTSPPAPQDGSGEDHGEATRGHQLTPRKVDAAATPAVWVCRNPICRAPETSSVSAPCGCGAWLERVDHAAADPAPPVKSVVPTGGMGDTGALFGAYADVLAERMAQDRKWGGPAHDDAHDASEWIDFIRERADMADDVADGLAGDLEYRHRLIQIAALAVAAVESTDRVSGRIRPEDCDGPMDPPADDEPPSDPRGSVRFGCRCDRCGDKLEADVKPPHNAAPDREQLGQEVHEVACARAQETGLAGARWDDLRARDRETACRIGERLFNLGAQHARQAWEAAGGDAWEALAKARGYENDDLTSALEAERAMLHRVRSVLYAGGAETAGEAAERVRRDLLRAQDALEAERERPAPQVSELVEAVIDVVTDYIDVPDATTARIRRHLQERLHQERAARPGPRLYPITPGPLAELADRVAALLSDVYSQPADGELRDLPTARSILRLVDEHLHGSASPPSAPAQGPTLEALQAKFHKEHAEEGRRLDALRELVSTWRARAALHLKEANDVAYGPWHSGNFTGRGRELGGAIADLCRVAGIEPPPSPPSTPGPQGTPDAPAQDGSSEIHGEPLGAAERRALIAAGYGEGADGTWCHLWAGAPIDPRTVDGLRELRDVAAQHHAGSLRRARAKLEALAAVVDLRRPRHEVALRLAREAAQELDAALGAHVEPEDGEGAIAAEEREEEAAPGRLVGACPNPACIEREVVQPADGRCRCGAELVPVGVVAPPEAPAVGVDLGTGPAKPTAVTLGQRWTCAGIVGELEVAEVHGAAPTGDVGLRPVGAAGPATVRARESDMLGLGEWRCVG